MIFSLVHVKIVDYYIRIIHSIYFRWSGATQEIYCGKKILHTRMAHYHQISAKEGREGRHKKHHCGFSSIQPRSTCGSSPQAPPHTLT